jgi:hypothetical protein
MEDGMSNLLRTFLLPFTYDAMRAQGLCLAPAPYPFETSDGFNPGSLDFYADTLASSESSLGQLLYHVGSLRAFNAKVELLEAQGLMAVSFKNPVHDPHPVGYGFTLFERRRMKAEGFTLFVELHSKLVKSVVEEPLISFSHGTPHGGPLAVLSALGYHNHLFGFDDGPEPDDHSASL